MSNDMRGQKRNQDAESVGRPSFRSSLQGDGEQRPAEPQDFAADASESNFLDVAGAQAPVGRESQQVQKMRLIINEFPLERELGPEKYDRQLIQDYRHFVPNIAIYVRAVDFTNPREVAECYSFLDTSEQAKSCKAEDALALLDAEFGDERVRLFAVTKLSELSDTFLSLYIPQLVQAMKYEVHHKSPLSEFLLERSL